MSWIGILYYVLNFIYIFSVATDEIVFFKYYSPHQYFFLITNIEICTVQCTLYTVHCAMYNVQCINRRYGCLYIPERPTTGNTRWTDLITTDHCPCCPVHGHCLISSVIRLKFSVQCPHHVITWINCTIHNNALYSSYNGIIIITYIISLRNNYNKLITNRFGNVFQYTQSGMSSYMNSQGQYSWIYVDMDYSRIHRYLNQYTICN